MVSPITAITGQETPINQASGSGTIQRITQAIKQASARTGVDFSYLLNKASQESGFDPNAKASTSSATGLFQFTSQTWLQMVKAHGTQYGLGQYAGQITTDTNGVDHVSDPATRRQILSLRNDPTVSAEMAGELDKQNASALQSDVGGKIGPTELYLAHFLGASGAGDFIDTLRSNPKTAAANVLPGAAAANPSVFFDKSGAPRSVGQIYQQFAAKFNNAPQIPANATMLASADTSPSVLSTAMASNIKGVSNGTSLPVMSGTMPHSPSLYSAMVIAQMDMKNVVDNQLTGTSGLSSAHKKNSALGALETIA